MNIPCMYPVYMRMYLSVLIAIFMRVFQHAHIENIKTVANLTNNKDVFMCIMRFNACVGYLQHYETLLKPQGTERASWI